MSGEHRTYSITELAERTGLAPHTLRWYEQVGLLADVGRGPGGRRAYASAHLGELEIIVAARQAGMSVADMTRYLALLRAGEDAVEDRRDLLESHRARVCTLIHDLQASLDQVDRLLGRPAA